MNQRIERQVRSHFSIPASVQLKIGERRPSEFPGYDALNITFIQAERNQNYEFLLSKDGKTLIRMTKLDISKDPYADIMSKIDISGRPVKGNKDAKVTIVNYDDFQCPFCSHMHQTLMTDVAKQYADKVRIVYKDFPLMEIHPWAVHAAVNANCLARESGDAYWAYADYVHANQRQINRASSSVDEQKAVLDKAALEQAQRMNLPMASLQACIKKQDQGAVLASSKEGTALGVEATPTLYVNGEKIDGALPSEQVKAVIDRALKQAGEQPPPAAQASVTPSK